MRILSAFLSLFIASNSPDTANATHLRVVRSLAAEGALNLRLERGHQISVTYAVVMRNMTRQSLLSEEKSAKSPPLSRFVLVATRALARRDEPALIQVVSELNELLDS